MNIVMLDSDQLAGEPDFPEVDLPKFGWLQYTHTPSEETSERCWRGDVIVSVSTPVDKETIDKAFKLKMIIAAGEKFDHIDIETAQARGIKICNVPGLDPANSAESQQICDSVIETINALVKGQEHNRVA
ncbi:hypothetical protein BOW53_12235 [Solemya pervernicosa gill symbiont]|uniref:D-isomer specific 2-hydroxyacid dehydrogenase catalytic domain-containing protein n=2 Tax=Gammaproteobacteria incertae sedis TaxID=118884 RepID=A0A1T2L2I8_9GAMM|nr:hypothetical protein [Candidatus Reidiella endopervernicosa]OOZ39317.1 hypothetical protein BOW53_12235 [Solemya pervernicosa gill symbiont]QKQ25497.1 hypothetical protein HUE57_03675 [Candidatus Reidiella endopervernicosa]